MVLSRNKSKSGIHILTPRQIKRFKTGQVKILRRFFIYFFQAEELNTMAKEHEKNPSVLPNNEFEGLMCEHKDSNVNYFALGLCESCYKDEWGNLSDIDDEEVDGYLFNEKEMHYMNILWENWNQEYEEQAADEAVAAAKKEFYDAILNKCMEDVVEARGRYESAVTALAKFRKEKQRRAQQAKTKSLGNEVNFDRLEKLFEHEPLADEEHY